MFNFFILIITITFTELPFGWDKGVDEKGRIIFIEYVSFLKKSH